LFRESGPFFVQYDENGRKTPFFLYPKKAENKGKPGKPPKEGRRAFRTKIGQIHDDLHGLIVIMTKSENRVIAFGSFDGMIKQTLLNCLMVSQNRFFYNFQRKNGSGYIINISALLWEEQNHGKSQS